MTEGSKHKSFDEIRIKAKHAAGRARLVAAALEKDNIFAMSDGDDYIVWAKKMAEVMLSVHTALDIIAEASNAYINREALDAFQWELDRTEEVLAEGWVKEVLEQNMDPIPF